MQIILFNGPPRSGKDTAANFIPLWCPSAKVIKFAEPLKNAVHALHGMDVTADGFESYKEQKLPDFFGLTPRQAYIWLSEECVKPTHPLGKHFFGWVASRRVEELDEGGAAAVVFSDSGFASEVQPLLSRYPADAFTLVHMHRNGCGFVNDSRSYIELPGVRTVELHNNGSLFQLRERVYQIYNGGA